MLRRAIHPASWSPLSHWSGPISAVEGSPTPLSRSRPRTLNLSENPMVSWISIFSHATCHQKRCNKNIQQKHVVINWAFKITSEPSGGSMVGGALSTWAKCSRSNVKNLPSFWWISNSKLLENIGTFIYSMYYYVLDNSELLLVWLVWTRRVDLQKRHLSKMNLIPKSDGWPNGQTERSP